LPDRLQNGTHKGKGGVADKSTHGRLGLGTTCKAETSRMENASVKSSAGVEENCVFTGKFF
jgi:hypothetical protein